MGLGTYNGLSKVFCSINKQGKIRNKNQDGVEQFFDYLEGRLLDIVSKDGQFEGTTTYRMQLTLEDNGELFSLECGRYSGFGKDVILKLLKADEYDSVRIAPFISVDEATKKEYVRGSVRSNNVKIQVTKDDLAAIPAVEKAIVGKKEVLDDTARNEYYDELIVKLSEKVKAYNRFMDQTPVTSDVDAEEVGF